MNNFKGITDLQQAKLRYRVLAKQMHPDKGGSALEFQKMQKEYRNLLLSLQNGQIVENQSNDTNEILDELSKVALELIKKRVPQNILKNRINKSKSPLEKGLLFGLVNILNKM